MHTALLAIILSSFIHHVQGDFLPYYPFSTLLLRSQGFGST